MTKRKRSDNQPNQYPNRRPYRPTLDEGSSANAFSLFNSSKIQPKPQLASKPEPNDSLFEAFNDLFCFL